MFSKQHHTILGLSLLSLTTGLFAQTQPSQQSFNPFNRQFITTEAATGSPTTQPANTSTNPVQPPVTIPTQPPVMSALSPEQQKLFQKYGGATPSTTGASAAAGKQQPLAPPEPQPTNTQPKTISQPKKQIQRYIPDTDTNDHSISYYESMGTKKNNYYANKYENGAVQTSTAASNPKQLTLLEPYIKLLRNRGVDEGKISVELNRLTPAQFIHWCNTITK